MDTTVPTYGPKTRAFYATIRGDFIPCIYLGDVTKEYGTIGQRVRVKFTADRPGFKKGDVFDTRANWVYPRVLIRRRGGKPYVTSGYRWVG